MSNNSQTLLEKVNAIVGTRYSRFSDLTVFPDSLLFNRNVGDETNVNLNLFRLEILSAVLFNEQLAIPQTVYISSILGHIYGEMQEATKELKIEERLPLVFKQPFRPALANEYRTDDPRKVFTFQLDQFKKSPPKGIFVELDLPEGDGHLAVRDLIRRMCESATKKEEFNKHELIRILGDVGPRIYDLQKSYLLSKPLRQEERKSENDYGKKLSYFLSHDETRKAISNNCKNPNNKDVLEKFIDSKKYETLEGRGALRVSDEYKDYRNAINEELIDLINFVFHLDIAGRVKAGYSSIEALPHEKMVRSILNVRNGEIDLLEDKSIICSQRLVSYTPESFKNLDESIWANVWKWLAETIIRPRWRNMIAELKNIDEKNNKGDFKKKAEAIFEYFLRDDFRGTKDYVDFDLSERTLEEIFVEKTKLYNEAPIYEMGAKKLAYALEGFEKGDKKLYATLKIPDGFEKFIPVLDTVSVVSKPIAKLAKSIRDKDRRERNLLNKVVLENRTNTP